MTIYRGLNGVESGTPVDTALEDSVTFENLDANGDVGTDAGQVAIGDHLHTGVYEPTDTTIIREGDTSTSSMAFVVDEDDMIGDSATVVPTQQSVKAYADGLLGSGLSTPIFDTVDIIHTATEDGDHAFEIDADAAGFGDVKAVDVVYTTGSLSAGEDDGVILVNIDETLATGGTVAALEVLTTAIGSATVDGMLTGVNVHPVKQLSGTFGNADTILNNAVDVTAALATGGAGNITVFVADNDTITIGYAAKFEEIEVILDTGANRNTNLTFEYSTGVGTWAAFIPVDGTNGFRNTGDILWLISDIPSWVVGTGSEYLIRITRTRNSLVTRPIVDVIQVSNATEYTWDKDGVITASSFVGDGSSLTGVAPLASPTFTGVPLSPTPATSDDSTKIATTAFINALLASREYVSPEITIVAAGATTLTHGLGAKPTKFSVQAICKVADGGYGVGDVVEIAYLGDGGGPYGVAVYQDNDTEVKLKIANRAQPLFVVDNSTGGYLTLTTASWRLIVRASL